MAEAAPRRFTREEVDGLIPRLAAIVARVKQAHEDAGRLRTAVREDQRRVMLAGGMLISPETWRSRRAAIERATTLVQRGVGEILELGGEPKDLDVGLVDFRGLLGGREVNLCWKLGETRLGFWHGLDEGYAARRPLP
jgi:hypothetical protein